MRPARESPRFRDRDIIYTIPGASRPPAKNRPREMAIRVDELESMISGMDRKPYLLLVADAARAADLSAAEGIQALDEFNQREIMRDRTAVFILADPDRFRPGWKGYTWVFTVPSADVLNPAIHEMVQVHLVD